MMQTFYVALATAALSLAGSAAMPWLSVKHKKSESAPAAAEEEEAKREDSTTLAAESEKADSITPASKSST
jgi:hypothetical protein